MAAGCPRSTRSTRISGDSGIHQLPRIANIACQAVRSPTTEVMGIGMALWRAVARTGGDDRIDPWSRARLPELAALEGTWAAHAAGGTLLPRHPGRQPAAHRRRGDGGGLAARLPRRRVRRPGVLRPQRGDAGRSRARGAARAVPRRAGRQPPSGHGGRLRAGRLLHRTLAPASATRIADREASRPPKPRSPAAGWPRCYDPAAAPRPPVPPGRPEPANTNIARTANAIAHARQPRSTPGTNKDHDLRLP
jgi:hypothetical protein